MSSKWMILILYTFVSNFLHYFLFYQNKVFILFDLLIKIGIVFIPNTKNQHLQKMINCLHMERLISISVLFAVKQFLIGYCFVTSLLYRNLPEKQKDILRIGLLRAVGKQKANQCAFIQNTEFGKINQFNNNVADVFCQELQNMPKIPIEAQLYEMTKRKEQPVVFQIRQHNEQKQKMGNSRKSKQMHQRPHSNGEIVSISNYLTNNQNLHAYGSSNEMGLGSGDYLEKQRTNSKTIQYYKINQELKPNYRQEEDEPSIILNKIEASEFSENVFQESEGAANRKLVAKVEVIIEMGVISSVCLEIYNIELYSNDEIRIVSLYGREFQKHRLVSMRPLKNGYYQLKLEGGIIKSRNVKFRGPFDSFLKFLV